VIKGHRIVMTHGSPASINEHLHPDTPEAHLKELAAMANAEMILCGHSHQSFLRKVGDVQFINPGTVGRPDDGDPRASYAILDFSEGDVKVEFHRIPYDIASAIRSMRQTGLPEIFSQVLAQGLSYNDILAKFSDVPEGLASLPNGAITLLTDFSTSDHFTGVMKGVILEMAPQAHMVDITHQISPQDVMQGAHMLAEATPYFAPGTVHVAVVDPGVGTNRRALAAHIGTQYYVAPDNGLLSFVLQQAQKNGEIIEIFALDQSKYWLSRVSHSFHGRDIFAPVGAHLANGLPIEKLGTPIDDPVIIKASEPIRKETGWVGEVISIDTFGNLSTNIKGQNLPQEGQNLQIHIEGETVHGLTRAFADAPPDTLIATIDSSGALAISVVNGNAQERLGVHVGSQIRVMLT
jgi:S-adenosylmethionine hydrolase